jgi:uncharacterized membrane protein YeaQ/YmgE (transglycosylase-associated protein family)
VSILVWLMMGIAVWHFTVFVPVRFWGGIVGAFLAAILGALVISFLLNGLSVPGQDDTDLLQAFIAIPGAVAGLVGSYLYGAQVDRRAGVDHALTHAGSH